MNEAHTNIYWPIYKNLENEMSKLMFYIHVDDSQLSVYSSKISDLILRASTEIESISKELYFSNGGERTGEITYDKDAIKFLKRKWILDKKIVIIGSYNCFQTLREIYPFKKNETRTNKNYMTYGWNNAYQNLKHDRAKSLHFGSVRYLFDVMAALYLLNIYYKNQYFELELDHNATNFPNNLGSELFSIKLHIQHTLSMDGSYKKNDDFDECVYVTKATDEALSKAINVIKNAEDEVKTKLLESALNRINSELPSAKISNENEVIELIKKFIDEEKDKKANDILSKAILKDASVFKKIKYEAILNRNQL